MQITGGKLNSRKIKTEKYKNIKPTLSKTRQGIFNSLSSMLDFEGKSFLDMFSGSGIIALEAYSREFEPVYAIELDKKTALSTKENFLDLKTSCKLFIGDAMKVSKKLGVCFDVIFLDPPYETDLYDRALNIIRETNLLSDNGIIIMEHPSAKQIDTSGFNIAKVKDYSDVSVTFLQKIN